jgi:hypothetical protein
MMAAAKLDMTIEQGATFRRSFTLQDAGVVRDLTGYKGRMQIRAPLGSNVVAADLTTENGGLTLGADGGIAVYIGATATASMSFDKASYDLEIEGVTADDVERLLKGTVTLDKQVTR